MQTKKVIPTISDVETGEILYQLKQSENDYFSYKTFNIGDFEKSGESFCRKVFDSFLRGVKSGRNLCLMITIRDYELPIKKEIF